MIYIAAGWFNPEMAAALDDIKLACYGHDIFSPKDDTNPKDGWDSVFADNIKHLNECDIVVASTACKDMGTLFECGYAHSLGKPIVYYAPGLKGDFNLMLSKSAHIVCTSYQELLEAALDDFPYREYKGSVE